MPEDTAAEANKPPDPRLMARIEAIEWPLGWLPPRGIADFVRSGKVEDVARALDALVTAGRWSTADGKYIRGGGRSLRRAG